jgi:hypothetical protein
MGRYAYFNTGFEYKFAFGVQGTHDIETFGGTDTSIYDTSGDLEEAKREWKQEDKEYILERLKELADENQFEVPVFTEIEKTIEGTYLMSEYIRVHRAITSEIGEPYYTFRLGCFIYHQLSYMDVLTVSYEV